MSSYSNHILMLSETAILWHIGEQMLGLSRNGYQEPRKQKGSGNGKGWYIAKGGCGPRLAASWISALDFSESLVQTYAANDEKGETDPAPFRLQIYRPHDPESIVQWRGRFCFKAIAPFCKFLWCEIQQVRTSLWVTYLFITIIIFVISTYIFLYLYLFTNGTKLVGGGGSSRGTGG